MRLEPLCWLPEQLGQALEAVARKSGLEPRSVTLPSPGNRNEEELGRWLELAAEELGLEAEPVEASYADLDAMLRGCGPGLLRLALDGGPRFLAMLGGGRRGLRLLGPDLQVYRIGMEAVRAVLCSKLEAPLGCELEPMLAAAGVAARRRARSLAVLLRARLGAERIGGCWLLRQPPQAAFLGQLRRAGLMRLLGGLFALRGVEYLLLLGSWWMIGRSALQGRFDPGWLLAWALMLLTMVPLQLLEVWWQGRLAVGAGSLLKRRLLHGALRLEPEAIRREGAGQLLGRVIESAAVESLALGGGILALISVVELLLAGMVLAAGAGGGLHLALFAAWTALTALLGWRYLVQRRLWTQERLGMTNELVERMVGHRTRLAQETPERWHEGEDQALDRYLGSSAGMDRSTALLWVLVPRGWLVAGVAGLAPAFVSGDASAGSLAVALGGILLAERGLQRLGNGLVSLAGAAISWEQVAPLFHASAKGLDSAVPSTVPPAAQEPVLIDAHELWFRHRPRGEAVLKGCSLRIRPGERLLLEGPSGGGKSTLASLLSGLREQESGLLLLGGLDRRTLGAEGWRRRVATAPQFHENHVLTETFAFNVLMGRRWPPHQEDMEEAERVCRELGLGELLERMPAGLLQMVGETGWQLSHGERSRLYIARALLQRADAIVLDESFAALDPENLRRALECVLRRAPALLVIAHP